MTFLNPLVLLGLAAAAIPILLHLFNLRKLRTIEFSTLSFIKELQRTKIRRLKIRQLLLMILRTLIIVLLVFSFSRPTLKGTVGGGVGSRAKTTAVLILDDSQSMTAANEQGEFLRQAREACFDVLNLLSESDEVVLLRLSDVKPGVPQDELVTARNLPAVRAAIEETRPSFLHRKL
ncbi:MAG: BatA domain-containing protein, partial [Bacteroidota bacterium]